MFFMLTSMFLTTMVVTAPADRSNVRVQRQLTVKDDAKVTSCVDDRYAG